MTTSRTQDLVDQMLEGSELALARLISLVENEPACMSSILPLIDARVGQAHTVGFTGPPGAGKSSLVNQVTRVLRKRGHKVGIIAVDPTSPFTGGAFLGDRIRMQGHYLDPGVFIRSMATRGSYGGLAQATKDVVKLIDAYGMPYILVETVGVGQTELDVMQATDTTVVALVPESGDSIQAMKAGLMEIGDVFAVNKSDRPGAEDVAAQLKIALHMNPRYENELPPIFLTRGTDGAGVEELVDGIMGHRQGVSAEELEMRKRDRRNAELEEILTQAALREFRQLVKRDESVREQLRKVVGGERDPYTFLREAFPSGVLNGNHR